MIIQTLINKQDNVELVRDAVTQILADETASQQTLATAASLDPTMWAFRVYRERSNPWDMFQNPDSDMTPIVNVSIDTETLSGGDAVQTSNYDATINIDTICAATSKVRVDGHEAGDEQAALARDRITRLVRNILASANYTYLGLRGVVRSRAVTSMTYYNAGEKETGVFTLACRLSLSVKLIELSPQIDGEPLNVVHIDIKHADDGSVLAALEYDYN